MRQRAARHRKSASRQVISHHEMAPLANSSHSLVAKNRLMTAKQSVGSLAGNTEDFTRENSGHLNYQSRQTVAPVDTRETMF